MPDMGTMIYDTKTALILRRDLAAWQVANVAAFLAGGLTGTHGHMVGEPYRDGAGRLKTAEKPPPPAPPPTLTKSFQTTSGCRRLPLSSNSTSTT